MPVKFGVKFTAKAGEDIEEIWGFIAEDSQNEATSFVLQLEQQISKLERFPQRCPLISENEFLHTRYRHLIYGKYRTIFRISGRTVFVLRVIHSTRLLDLSMID
jgi:plasmid stabilization system protein ParE